MLRIVILLAVSFLGVVLRGQEASRMDYHDYEELRKVLVDLHASPNAQGKKIGESFLYDRSQKAGYGILAVRLTTNGPTFNGAPDKGDSRPCILFDAGIHPREWFTTECLVELAKYLVDELRDPDSRASRSMRAVDVWIVPLSNPSGRIIDDLAQGDPTKFYSEKGTTVEPGWRGNGDRRVGAYGVDVARNFSHDWQSANTDPNGEHWRGIAPFSSSEACALREFVQNHSVTMAVHLHTTTQDIGNLWGKDDVAGSAIRQRAAEAWDGGCDIFARRIGTPLNTLKLTLDQKRLGTSSGQFTAWLASASDVRDQPDFGSERNIQAFIIELPFDNANLKNYYDGPFQWRAKDGSNSFHPSSENVRTLVRDAFIPMALTFIEHAAVPCLAAGDDPIHSSGDVGILAAKIIGESGAPGRLVSRPAHEVLEKKKPTIIPARDYLLAGQHRLFFCIQNYTSMAQACRYHVTIETRRSGKEDAAWVSQLNEVRELKALAAQERHCGEVGFSVANGNEYRLTVQAIGRSDSFANNNRKVFRYEGVSRLPPPRDDRLPRN